MRPNLVDVIGLVHSLFEYKEAKKDINDTRFSQAAAEFGQEGQANHGTIQTRRSTHHWLATYPANAYIPTTYSTRSMTTAKLF